MVVDRRWLEPLISWSLWLPPAAMACFLVVLAQYSFLAFHTLAELFAIVISFVMVAFALSIHNFARNNFLLFLACGYFWIGSLDLVHTLVYKGMNVFVEGTSNLSSQTWLSARYSEALLLLTAPFAAKWRLNGFWLIAVFGIIAMTLTALVLSGSAPTTFVEGQGLTDFKIYSEYLIDLTLALALIALFMAGRGISSRDKTLIAVSIVMTMFAELAFTFYVSVYGFSNLVGHILKIFSFWMIFQAIVVSNLQKPFRELVEEKETSERQLAQIKEHENRLEAMFNAISDCIILADTERRIVAANRGMERTFGYTFEEVAGKTTSILYESEEEYERVGGIRINQTAAEQVAPHEISYRRKDGQTFVGETLRAAIEGGNGEPLGYVGVVRDISYRKDLERQVRRAQKMDAVGQLTGGIAHDFNNILGIVMGNLELLLRHSKDTPRISQYADTALQGTVRGAELTRKLLSFSRRDLGDTKVVSANDCVAQIRNLIAKSLTAAINVENHLAEDLWQIRIDPGDLEDSILNLALNARDAMPMGGTLIIETANKTLDEDYARRNPSTKAGEYVLVSVSDTGSGMTDEVREKVFEPFFSTKGAGQGTGLGLSMVYGFVQRSGGHIKIYSAPGKGSTFHVYLPRAQDGAEDGDTAAEHQAELPGGKETVLIVDDEDALLSIAVSYLEELGYETVTASSGGQAMECLEAHPEIDLLFCDIIMPGARDGYQVAKVAHNSHRDLKILLTSGFTRRHEEYANGDGEYLDQLARKLLAKPYNQAELATAVRQALDEPVPSGS